MLFRSAHTLKGVAGNIAATNLQAVAAALEASLTAGRPNEVVRRLPELATCMTEILNAADILEQSLTAAGNTVTSLSDPARLPPLLAELSRLLDRRELYAQELFAQVRPLLVESDSTRTEKMARAMDKLEYRQALSELKILASELSITLKEG